MNKKIFIYFAVGILIVCFVIAAGIFSYNETIQGTITGTGVLVVVQDISDFSLDVSDQNVTNIQNISLFNRNGIKILTLNLTVNKIPTDPFCTDFINDCSVVLKNATSIVSNGDSINFFPGFKNFTLETSCIQFTCGQNISIELDYK